MVFNDCSKAETKKTPPEGGQEEEHHDSLSLALSTMTASHDLSFMSDLEHVTRCRKLLDELPPDQALRTVSACGLEQSDSLSPALMERFLSPGFKVKPLEERESTQKVRRGRPAKHVPEGALDLGQPKVRRCGSKQYLEAELTIASLERQVEALKLCQQSESKKERMDKMLQMLDEAEEQNKGLLEQMRLKRCLSFEEDEGGRKRKHDGGVLSPKMLEVCE